MEVVLEGTTANGQGRELEEVDEHAKGKLSKVEHEDRDAPFLVSIVRAEIVVHLHGCDPERKTCDDDG